MSVEGKDSEQYVQKKSGEDMIVGSMYRRDVWRV